jgi:Fe-S-cluster containining protein
MSHAAGTFSTWLDGTIAALAVGGDSDVPCGTCDACCSSAQFVHVTPDDVDALAHIPAELLFPAPGAPKGHQVMGYDEDGRCPMLTDTGCSIYQHRPQTCRQYDCRVFAATGVESDKPLIAVRVSEWEFDIDDPDRVGQLRSLVDVSVPNPTVRAVTAIEALCDG